MKRIRKGFTLVELLIVIAIIGVLAAMMTTSAGSASAVAKASSIYSNIRSIQSAALLYQTQEGDSFSEAEVDEDALKSFVDLAIYRRQEDKIEYEIEEGTTDNNNVLTAGAYVLCTFVDDGDRAAIATALSKYKNIRVNNTAFTVGAFLYHVTPADATDTTNYTYNRAFQ